MSVRRVSLCAVRAIPSAAPRLTFLLADVPHGRRHLVDEVVVERAINGERPEITMDERIVAAWFLHSRGYSDESIAARIGTAPSSIARWHANGWRPARSAVRPVGRVAA
ncbi:hypothetical protein [Streptomyces niveus]|uniref:hypothetical protein n=1 Tax=Streptomyces niveus TaxID=193462 RepID=UPI0003C635F3|nr:hypothetical protein [Streptomyces niveus]EST17862.1 hypothetical protein M877_40095 [Streptomyces niveus NCIMB 11891]